jgi:hypothetical protein
MGCDIHLVAEKKLKNGKWEIIKDKWLTEVNRDYTLFSILADVRNKPKEDNGYVKPISKPRGLPEDSPTKSFVRDSNTNFEDEHMWDSYWDPDDTHSHSYHTLKQLKEHDWESEHCYEYENFKKKIAYLQKIANECGGDENVRIVFCFDN